MNKKLLSLAILSLGLLCVACGPKEMTPEQIYNEQASGVVMVLNQYYYEATMPDGSSIFFSGLKDGELEGVSFDADSITKSMVFGTAFFIDGDGSLITNRHVVDPVIEPSEVKEYVRNLISSLSAKAEYAQHQMSAEYDALQSQIDDNTYVGYDDDYGVYATESPENDALRERQSELAEDYREAQDYIDGLRTIDVNELKIKTHSEISIAYHDSYVTKPEDFVPCVVVRTDDREEVDLALIRLKNKQTPSKAHIFTFPNDQGNFFGAKLEEREKITLNQPLTLIGYNHGVELASTREGIKAQLTTGNVSQEPDADRVMYTIPILQGSSGSPVLNKWGEVVAVNFASVRESQSFNFGIPLKRVKQFLEE